MATTGLWREQRDDRRKSQNKVVLSILPTIQTEFFISAFNLNSHILCNNTLKKNFSITLKKLSITLNICLLDTDKHPILHTSSGSTI